MEATRANRSDIPRAPGLGCRADSRCRKRKTPKTRKQSAVLTVRRDEGRCRTNRYRVENRAMSREVPSCRPLSEAPRRHGQATRPGRGRRVVSSDTPREESGAPQGGGGYAHREQLSELRRNPRESLRALGARLSALAPAAELATNVDGHHALVSMCRSGRMEPRDVLSIPVILAQSDAVRISSIPGELREKSRHWMGNKRDGDSRLEPRRLGCSLLQSRVPNGPLFGPWLSARLLSGQ